MSSAWRSRGDDLVRGLGRAQAEPGADLLLDPRVDLRVRADRPADRADAHGLAGPAEPLAVAVELERPERDLVPEARRLGDDPVRPAGHRRCRGARAPAASSTASSRSSRPSSRSVASRSCRASPVSSTSDDVSPKWTQRPAGPTDSATTCTKAATSCRVTRSTLERRARDVERRRRRGSRARRPPRHHAEPGQRLDREDLDLEPVSEPCLVGPDRRPSRGRDVPRGSPARLRRRALTAGGPPPGRP